MMNRIAFLLAVLLTLAGCGAQEPTSRPAGSAANLTPRPTVGLPAAPTQPAVPSPIPAEAPTAPPAAPTKLPAAPPAAPTEPAASSPIPPEAPTEPAAPSPIPAELTIGLAAPAAGAAIESPVRIAGRASLAPFEQNFVAAIYDSEGNQIGGGAITGVGEYGQPSDFDGEIVFTAPATTRPGKIVVFVDSPKDGSIISQAEVRVVLAGYAGGGEYLSLPAENARVTLPLHVEAANVAPQSDYALRLTYADGTVLEGGLRTPLHGPERSSAAANLDWDWETASAPPNPPSQNATLELLTRTGEVLSSRNIYVWDTSDPDANVMPLKLYFLLGEQLQEITRYVPRTGAVATAALRELSWGPPDAAIGFSSALPTSYELADRDPFPADWTTRVRLQSISIRDGVAVIDWSKEMAAWGGGSARLGLLTRQVEQTLAQFPTITGVSMTVDGSAEVLQP